MLDQAAGGYSQKILYLLRGQCQVLHPLILKTNENKLHDLLRTQLFQPMISKLDVLVQHIAKGSHPKISNNKNVFFLKYLIIY